MSTHKQIDRICCAVLAFTLILTALFMCAESLGVKVAAHTLGYEDRLFSTDKVHTIDIIIDDWDAFISTAQSEEYSLCSVVIDGEAVRNVGIRGKGNTSLSSVSSMGSERYSFKIEFDQYDSTKTYHGLDKLSLNNVIQDNTYMKDYLVYQMMNEFGVSAPLCSFANITVNGENWGLYLAVEAVEDGFLQRNYGSDYGELYKPDSMSFGGGKGNGKDFDMSAFETEDGGFDFSLGESTMPDMGNFDPSTMPSGGMQPPSGGSWGSSGMPDMGNFDPNNMPSGGMQPPSGSGSSSSGRPNMGSFGGMGGFGGMGSSDVKLQYIDDNASSYSNIFNNAKTDISNADANRLIASLKQLSSYSNLEEVVDVEMVIRYFVVHNFVVNADSYTGSMIHNYYLYEEDGKLSMIPWDYNLAFGTFMGSNASSSVNEDIDSVLSDRPMQAWIFSNEAYSSLYYELYAEMLETVDAQAIIDNAYSLIAPYVAKDPTAFCTYDEFEKGVAALKEFCSLRSQSVALQLSGSKQTVDASGLNISDMGTMGGGMGGGKMPSRSDKTDPQKQKEPSDSEKTEQEFSSSITLLSNNAGSADEKTTDRTSSWGSGQMPDMGDFDMSNMPSGNMQFPGNMQSGSPPSGQQNRNPASTPSSDGGLLLLSFAVLAAGLAFAKFFKRRK